MVQKENLLGVIVATYDKSPYVHMLPIDKIFHDIKSVVGGDGDPSEVLVSLPSTLAIDPEEERLTEGLSQDDDVILPV